MCIPFKQAGFLLLLFSFGSALQAQISAGGTPPSFTQVGLRAAVPLETMPSLDGIDLAQLEAQEDAQGLPPRFGYDFGVDYDLTNSGHWDRLPNGDRVWRLRLACPGAKSINLNYQRFQLPPGGRLFVYNVDRSQVFGAFTEANHKPGGGFATGLVYGDEITLEYHEPAAYAGQGQIELAQVVHGYRYIQVPGLGTRGFGDSGPCNINVACDPYATDWEDEITSVALILVSGIRFCTGALITNTRQDFTPYFLSADHCSAGQDAVSNPVANNWTFYWNYQSPGCASTDGPTNLSTNGATFVANDSDSDFSLLRLAEDPNDLPIDVFYAGWTRAEVAATNSVGIHHPSGDIKKICQENDPVTSSDFGTGVEAFWRVADWDAGVTEPGSSGSPLFDQNKRIVGQLFGGTAACSGNVDNGLPDYYGKISYSWDNNGATNPARRLRDWLDPDNTGALGVDGSYRAVNLAFEELELTFSETAGAGAPVVEGCLPYREADIFLSLSGPLSDGAVITFARVEGTATVGEDVELPGSLALNPGPAGTYAARLRIYDDARIEGEETLRLRATVNSVAPIIFAEPEILIRLADDDFDPLLTAATPVATQPSFPLARPLGPQDTVFFFDEGGDRLLARLINPSQHDFGCVEVAIDRAAGASAAFRNPDPAFFLAGKSFLLQAERPTDSVSLDLTLFYTRAEVDAWATATGQAASEAGLIGVDGLVDSVGFDNFFTYQVTSLPTERLAYGGDLGLRTAWTLDQPRGLGLGVLDPAFPQELVRFTGQMTPLGAELRWVTAREIGTAFFRLEHSGLFEPYESIHVTPAAGVRFDTSRYVFLHPQPAVGENQYRLIRIGQNGEEEILDTLLLRVIPEPGLKVLPIAGREDALRLSIYAYEDTPGELSVFQPDGRRLLAQGWPLGPGLNTVELSTEGWAAGIYFIRLRQGDKQLGQGKWLQR